MNEKIEQYRNFNPWLRETWPADDPAGVTPAELDATEGARLCARRHIEISHRLAALALEEMETNYRAEACPENRTYGQKEMVALPIRLAEHHRLIAQYFGCSGYTPVYVCDDYHSDSAMEALAHRLLSGLE